MRMLPGLLSGVPGPRPSWETSHWKSSRARPFVRCSGDSQSTASHALVGRRGYPCTGSPPCLEDASHTVTAWTTRPRYASSSGRGGPASRPACGHSRRRSPPRDRPAPGGGRDARRGEHGRLRQDGARHPRRCLSRGPRRSDLLPGLGTGRRQHRGLHALRGRASPPRQEPDRPHRRAGRPQRRVPAELVRAQRPFPPRRNQAHPASRRRRPRIHLRRPGTARPVRRVATARPDCPQGR